MSDLTHTRDHARAMADWRDPREDATWYSHLCRVPERWRGALDEYEWLDHDLCDGDDKAYSARQRPRLCACDCHPRDPGPSDAERAMWRQIADEIDNYLAADHDEEALW